MIASLYLSPVKGAAALGLGVLLAATGLAWGPEGMGWSSVVLAFALAWAVTVDIDRFILPDLIILPLVLTGLGLAIWAGFAPGAAADPWPLLHSAIGAAAGYAVLVAVAAYYRKRRGRDGLGRGDAKLLAAAGAWLGWIALPVVLLIASLTGLVWFAVMALRAGRIDTSQPIPFGPFIAMGFWVAWLFPELMTGGRGF